MKSNYNSLGKYIRVVSERNSNLQNQNLIGLSIEKKFIPSISNTIGTDMSTYRIINTNQFAYSPVTSRNGDKITIALYQGKEEAMISQAYTVFEISDSEKLLPEYLMMWFRRPEFDRYARFKSHGSAREIFEWDSMCAAELTVPHINKQKEIVKEYNTIVNRIKLNEQLCQKLEETAQALYKHWFINFEFPNQKGKPYKSDGGKMVFNKELNKEIPHDWEINCLSGIANYLNGLAMQNFSSDTLEYIPVIKIRELSLGFSDASSNRAKIDLPKNYVIDDGDIIFSWSGTLKVEMWSGGKGGLNQHLFKITSNKYDKWFYFLWTNFHLQEFTRIAEGKATSLGHIKREDLNNATVLIPSATQLNKMNITMNPIVDSILKYKIENRLLFNLKKLILSKLAT